MSKVQRLADKIESTLRPYAELFTYFILLLLACFVTIALVSGIIFVVSEHLI